MFAVRHFSFSIDSVFAAAISYKRIIFSLNFHLKRLKDKCMHFTEIMQKEVK
jgi:hypothetical protein